ncbi:hypothetical protein PK98_13825 [Croceibacterium mercuriale]|uniref:Lipoprotein n=1 Tax=Croceibacterium mercuriale TaxID=1572751 RepID=A0A0B2BU14_9SPHN|nr:hypothetical protein [Croceibacterium mercuriale]KHL24934.1 hypothetical protein PK98_13825 [Croceibacterium mercuriale]
MKMIALTAAAPLLFALAACGSSDDASEDAMADTVEMPADQAMTEAPMPAPDAGLTTAPAVEANEPVAEPVDTTAAAADAAAEAVADIESEAAAAEAATRTAESSM